MEITPEVAGTAKTILGGAFVYFAHRFWRIIRVRRRESVPTSTAPDIPWGQDREAREQVRDLLALSHDISKIADRLASVERWKDLQDLDGRKGSERLAVVEEQNRAIRQQLESQGEAVESTRTMLREMLDMLREELRDARSRLLALERGGR